jgi:hypothetical protein
MTPLPEDTFNRTSPPAPLLKERGVNPNGTSLLLQEKGSRDEVPCVESSQHLKKRFSHDLRFTILFTIYDFGFTIISKLKDSAIHN